MKFFKGGPKETKALGQTIKELSERVAELDKQNDITKAILSSMAEGVIAVDKDTRIISINPGAARIFGITRENSEGRFFLEAVRNNDISEIISDCLKRQAAVSRELALVWPLQKVFQVNASPLFDNSVISGCLLVIHDITEMRRLEAMRRDFVANVSHELKTPLTSIKGFVETLLEGALDDKENSRHFLEIIRDHSNRLDELINDLLELSRIESREAKLDIEQFGLRQLCEKILSGFKVKLKKKEIEARIELAQELSVKADKDKMEQVLTNLIDNAIKFNKDKGFVKIYSEKVNDKIKIVVEDSGTGVPEKDIPRIFERFYRVDKARSRELGGTGLGLSIVKHIIELHGGSVGVESTEGLGSKFWFILPA